MRDFTIFWTTGSKRRITTLKANSKKHAIDKVVSSMRGGCFAETRLPFTMFKAV